jgi:ribosomal protein L11 methyltransferase
MRVFPALTVRWPHGADPSDRLMAELDGLDASAVEELEDGLRVYFTDVAARDSALSLLVHFAGISLAAEDVADDDWAARSQASIGPVAVGSVIVTPPWHRASLAPHEDAHVIVVQPSMGFGTGHHATTRLCLGWLQQIPLKDARVLDAGTGSGLLAMAAVSLGAAMSVGIDTDADALQSAHGNLPLNRMEGRVSLVAMDLMATSALDGRFDVLVANLTGALIARAAPALFALSTPRARLIASGYQTYQADDVTAALAAAGWQLAGQSIEDEWVGALYLRDVTMTSPTTSRTS